jgi:hypothetical protein
MALLETTSKNFRGRFEKAVKKLGGDEDFLEMPDSIELTRDGDKYTLLIKPPEPSLLFRGDDRHGPGDIFKKGFYARNGATRPAFKSMQGDADGQSGTCASLNPAVGCLFPLEDGNRQHGAVDPMRLFVIYTGDVFYTHRIQQGLLQDTALNPGGPRGRDIWSRLSLNAWSQEVIAAGTVSETKVLGYFRVWRLWRGSEYKDGIKFKIDPTFIPNEACDVANSAALVRRSRELVAPYAASYHLLWIEERDLGQRIERKWRLEVE